VIPIQYNEAGCFSEGYAKVNKESNWGFIDKEGKMAIGFKYANVGNFIGGLAPVCNDNGLWGYINKSGREVINFKFSYADSFSEGSARVLRNGKWLQIDANGKEL
jgi:hypothetical protein